jgi:hypothetical protein
VENIFTGTALSSDHLPVICEVVTDVRREVLSHFVFDYKNANWTHFRQCLESRLNLDFSLDRIERVSDVDSMIQSDIGGKIFTCTSSSTQLSFFYTQFRAQVYHLT